MTIGIVGRKHGMTRVFTENGGSLPVTVIQAVPNKIVRLISLEKEAYRSVQVAWGENKKSGRVNKAIAGIYAKADIAPTDGLIEFSLDSDEEIPESNEIRVDMFQIGQKIDVSGISIGKGYSGVIKRHNFSHQRNSHGNSLSHRAPGSIGQCQTPGRVFKGKKMAGRMGNVRRTVQNLEVVRVDSDKGLLLVKGAVPGAKGGKVIVKPSVKTPAS